MVGTSHDTIERLEELLKLAREGKITGMAVAAMLKGEKFLVRIAGEANRDPTLARGMVKSIDDELSRVVHGRQR